MGASMICNILAFDGVVNNDLIAVMSSMIPGSPVLVWEIGKREEWNLDNAIE